MPWVAMWVIQLASSLENVLAALLAALLAIRWVAQLGKQWDRQTADP